MRTVILAPMTTIGRAYPFRPSCRFAGQNGHVVLDLLRTVDRERLRKRMGVLSAANQRPDLATQAEKFDFS